MSSTLGKATGSLKMQELRMPFLDLLIVVGNGPNEHDHVGDRVVAWL